MLLPMIFKATADAVQEPLAIGSIAENTLNLYFCIGFHVDER